MRASLLVLVSMLCAAGVQASDDLFLGTWSLDTQASHYAAGEMPRSMVIVMAQAPEGIRYRSVSVLPDGRSATAEYLADYLGNLAMVVGDAGMMVPVSVRRIDPYTVEATYIRGLKPVAVSRRVVSPDGSVMTITTSSPGQSAPALANVGVYVRVAAPVQVNP
jgi:hypothetical protein